MRLGIDCGSRSVKAVLLDDAGRSVRSCYRFNEGLAGTLREVVGETVNGDKVSSVGVTGSGREFAAMLVGADVVETEILAHAVAVLKRYPKTRTVFDIGGEDAKIIVLRDGTVTDFRMNHICGAGTGAVIDAIAGRMGVTIEEVADLALSSTRRLDFPGKCGVFCQSSVVSRLNAGVSKADILMGVLRALASNFLLLAKGIRIRPPYLFQGATAKNEALVLAICEATGDEVSVPEEAEYMGAVGAAMLAGDGGRTNFQGMRNLAEMTSEIHIGTGCENRCEITTFRRGNRPVGHLGNRCDRCVKGAAE